MKYYCQTCGAEFGQDSTVYRCPCGGLLSLRFEENPLDFSNLPKDYSLWRYIGSMPFTQGDQRDITMGEGFTPLIQPDLRNPNLFAKCDYYMPTLSFKDRGAVALIAMAKKLGVTRVVADSSGNAGTAIAAYAARAGIACDVFVPDSTSDKKVKQITAHGAVIHKIPGSREDTAKAAIACVEEQGAFYASHIFNPLFYEGTKTYFFELYEQMETMPDGVIVPVGNGTLLLGAYRAFQQMLDWGTIDKMPVIYAVQAENCSPIEQAFVRGDNTVNPVENKGTLAEGIAIAAPARGEDILAAVRATKGDIITVNEEEIASARDKMAKMGIFVEITSAANYAAYENYCKKYLDFKDKVIVLPLCGAGIKSN